ncbi:plasmid partition protein ParG [Peribacillus simplex]|uniref:plasmid partition protein ParG n=1 Tax=Peribacillus simplex TaxID=1478 RepID=UPI003D285C6A
MSFLDKHQNENVESPFAKKTKAAETKVVKLNAELHYKLKLYVAKKGTGITITDLVNEAVTQYIKNSDIEKTLKEE